jgi:hypothetical protein
MIEFTTLVTLSILYLIFFRPGKTPPLENPLVIERPGQYHMTLAPHLNLAQPFIEEVASRIVSSYDAASGCETKYFEVRDKQVKAHGFDFYLLAVTRRNGMLFFQAARPLSKDQTGQLHTISEFSRSVLARFPDDAAQGCVGEDVAQVVQQVAGQRGMQIRAL